MFLSMQHALQSICTNSQAEEGRGHAGANTTKPTRKYKKKKRNKKTVTLNLP
jgi:hypothetical protein